jgi:hypothetical protein
MVLTKLREMVREKLKREASPSLGIIDSQSIKNSEWGLPDKGFDDNKKIKGRKRHIVMDCLGILLCVVETQANIHDSVAAETVLKRMRACFDFYYIVCKTIMFQILMKQTNNNLNIGEFWGVFHISKYTMNEPNIWMDAYLKFQNKL